MTEALRKIAKQHAVKVAEGSGVLIQPATEDYSYILTAKHVVKETDFPELSSISVLDNSGNSITVQERYFHQEEDCDLAILKVEFQRGLELGYFYNEPTNGMPASIYGYPRIREPEQGALNEPSTYELILHDIRENEVLEFRNESQAIFEDIEGYSGCGIFYLSDKKNKVELVGIECRMAAVSSNDGHICGYKFNKFKEILQSHNLAEIKPPYLKSFKYHEANLFNSVELFNDDGIKCVKELAKYYFRKSQIYESSQINPESIIENFGFILLAYKQKNEDLFDNDSWSSFLEFLFIQFVIHFEKTGSEFVHEEFLANLFSDYRVIFDHEKLSYKHLWGRYIAHTSFEELKEAAKIIILSKGSKPPIARMPENLKKSPKNITEGSDNYNLIDRAIKNKAMNNPIFHWDALNEACIECNEEQFESLNLNDHKDQIEELVRNKYTKILDEG
ncbi:hypothetical protein BM524_13215 [Alteromonas mediterranea]|uniref:ABC-three component systems C-terminal domain-containing protein n=1 Tax=Alteromonas mediterranea TaxID=314275 RepID=A0AAC9JFR0_9ALTE|nr:ABC-three component system protein [Alteromonas mediterranea]APD90682.1 hypothetical protein BM524_13215 [Alteromonas mediterranea]